MTTFWEKVNMEPQAGDGYLAPGLLIVQRLQIIVINLPE